MVRNISLIALALPLTMPLAAAPGEVSFSPSAAGVEAYDFIEVTARITAPDVSNPFTGATLIGSFGKAGATLIGSFGKAGATQAVSNPPRDAGVAPSAWIRNTHGISFGKARGNTTSSTAQPLIG